MIKTNKVYVISVICFISLVIFQGCATDKAFVKQDLTPIDKIKVARYETPGLKVKNFWSAIGLIIPGTYFGGLLGGGGAIAADEIIAIQRGKSVVEKYELYDYGLLVMSKFTNRISDELPEWPEIIIENEPISDDYVYNEGHLITFKVSYIKIFDDYFGEGFHVKTTVEMKYNNNYLLWRRKYTYHPRLFGRSLDYKEFIADEGKLLKEEWEFAAEATVSAFFEHLRGSAIVSTTELTQ